MSEEMKTEVWLDSRDGSVDYHDHHYGVKYHHHNHPDYISKAELREKLIEVAANKKSLACFHCCAEEDWQLKGYLQAINQTIEEFLK